jgi:hypothetical protein
MIKILKTLSGVREYIRTRREALLSPAFGENHIQKAYRGSSKQQR